MTFLSMKNDVNVPSKSNKQKNLHLEGHWPKSRIRISEETNPEPEPYQNVTDPEHWFLNTCGLVDAVHVLVELRSVAIMVLQQPPRI